MSIHLNAQLYLRSTYSSLKSQLEHHLLKEASAASFQVISPS